MIHFLKLVFINIFFVFILFLNFLFFLLKYGSFFSYTDSPRSNIFRRDHSNVHDIPSMINMMRYNNYTYDPYSKCDCDPPYSGENNISARSDLNPASGRYAFGNNII